MAGCDRSQRFALDPANITYSKSPTSKAEYRVEEFLPPFFFYEDRKPVIQFTQADTMQFGEPFKVGYSFPGAAGGGASDGVSRSISRAVLMTPCSATHSVNMHQRLVSEGQRPGMAAAQCHVVVCMHVHLGSGVKGLSSCMHALRYATHGPKRPAAQHSMQSDCLQVNDT